MAIQQPTSPPNVSNLPEAPDSASDNFNEFDTKANAYVAAQIGLPPEINASNSWVKSTADITYNNALDAYQSAVDAKISESAAASSGNYEGDWSTLTGSYSKGISVSHNGGTYRLKVDLADITTSEPSEANNDWFLTLRIDIKAGDNERAVMSQKAATEIDDKALGYASTIWDENEDKTSIDGAFNGATQTHQGMRRCLLNDNGTVNYYLDANDSTLKDDGTDANIDGTDGQVMVEIPRCYVKALHIQGGNDPIVEWSVSPTPKEGYVIHPAFTRGGDLIYNDKLKFWHYVNVRQELDYIYVGAYQASVYDVSAASYIDGLNLDNNTSRVDLGADKLASVSGKYPMIGLARAEFRTLAENRGSGWQQMDFWTHSLLQLLYTVEYRNLNSQVSIGNGNVSVSSGYPASSTNQTDSPHSFAGKSNSIGNGTGSLDSNARDAAWMSYRGVENFWGNCFAWVDGVNVLDRVYHVNNTGSYIDNTTVNGYTQLGVAAPDTDSYIRKVQADTLSYIPSNVSGGSSSIAFSDYYYQSTGYRAISSGGSAGSRASAGAFILLASFPSGYRNRSLGGRVMYRQGQSNTIGFNVECQLNDSSTYKIAPLSTANLRDEIKLSRSGANEPVIELDDADIAAGLRITHPNSTPDTSVTINTNDKITLIYNGQDLELIRG